MTDKLNFSYFRSKTNGNEVLQNNVNSKIFENLFAHNIFINALTHNILTGLQGGQANEYYHLTSAEYTGTGTGVFVRKDTPLLTGTPTVNHALVNLYQFVVGATTNDNYLGVRYSATAVNGAGYISHRARGTESTPTKVTANDVLGGLYAKGYYQIGAPPSEGWSANVGAFRILAYQDFEAGRGSFMDWATTANNGTYRTVRMYLDQDGSLTVGTVKGGASGTPGSIYSGNINIGHTTLSTDGFISITSKAKAYIDLIADYDNSSETDTAYIKMSQDNAANIAFAGMVSTDNKLPDDSALTGTIANMAVFGTSSTIGSGAGTGGIGLLSNGNLIFRHYGNWSNRRMEFFSQYDAISLNVYSDTLNFSAGQIGNRYGGTLASPTKVTSGMVLMGIYGAGYQETTSALTLNVGSIRLVASQDFTSTTAGTYWDFAVTNTGEAARVIKAKLEFSKMTFGGTSGTFDLVPYTNGGGALGTTALSWSDLFIASGGVINFNNGDMTITHGSNILTFAGGTTSFDDINATTGSFSELIKYSVDATVTASTTQSQGERPLTKEINNISVCANDNDVVTLPVAVPGYRVTVINSSAKILQIFPASGDDLGAGVNTSTTLAAGQKRLFESYDTTNYR